MTHLGYLIAGWGLALGVLAVYGISLVRKGRALAAAVPADRRRWMTTEEKSTTL